MRNQTALKVMTYKLNENVIRSRTEPKKKTPPTQGTWSSCCRNSNETIKDAYSYFYGCLARESHRTAGGSVRLGSGSREIHAARRWSLTRTRVDFDSGGK